MVFGLMTQFLWGIASVPSLAIFDEGKRLVGRLSYSRRRNDLATRNVRKLPVI
jgi:hypothetical protein